MGGFGGSWGGGGKRIVWGWRRVWWGGVGRGAGLSRGFPEGFRKVQKRLPKKKMWNLFRPRGRANCMGHPAKTGLNKVATKVQQKIFGKKMWNLFRPRGRANLMGHPAKTGLNKVAKIGSPRVKGSQTTNDPKLHPISKHGLTLFILPTGGHRKSVLR